MKSLVIVAALLLSPLASAEVVATCGASDGYGYFVPAGLNPEGAGWESERISKGSFQLIRDGITFDIIYTDASGGTVSSKGDGGTVLGTVTKDGYVVVQVVYPINIETYVFWLALDKPIVTFSQAKFGTRIPKHSVMRASCKLGA